MAFLHLWDKGGHPWEREGERAREELKVCRNTGAFASMHVLILLLYIVTYTVWI